MPGDSVGRSAALTTREANVVADEGTGGAYGEESERLSGGRREGDVANGGGSFEDETRGLGLSNVLCETHVSAHPRQHFRRRSYPELHLAILTCAEKPAA